MDDNYRKDIASELRSAITMQETRAIERQRAENAYVAAKASTDAILWRLAHEKLAEVST